MAKMNVPCNACGSYEWHAEGSLWCKERAREGALRKAKEAAWDEGAEAALDGIPGGDEYASAIAAHARALVNPYRAKKDES